MDKKDDSSSQIDLCGTCDSPNVAHKLPAMRLVLPLDVIDIPITAVNEDLYEIPSLVIIGTSTKNSKVTKVAGLQTHPRLRQLQELVIRSCLVSTLEGVQHLSGTLRKLELYDNQIDDVDVEALKPLAMLRILDLSFNSLRSMDFLSSCFFPHLEELYIAQNKLRKIEGLEGLPALRVLDLGANRIRVR